MRWILPVLIGLAWPMSATATTAPAARDVDGYWLTASRSGIVHIADCGDGTPCGTLVWIITPDPVMPKDGHNPDPEMRNRPLLGVQMLSGFRAGDDKWKKGRIYNPEDGKSYRSAIARKGENVLEVKGCIGPVCQSQTWYRIDLQAWQANASPKDGE